MPPPIIVLVVAVMFVSAAYSFYYHDRPRVDAQAYDRIGWNLARGLGYIEDERNTSNPRADDAIVRLGPGYEFFLAGIYSIVGHQIWVVWLVHAFLRGITTYMVYAIGQFLFVSCGSPLWRERVALLAAFLFGFSPDLIVINGLLLTETFFLFLIVAAIYGTLRLFDITKPQKVWHTGFVGLLWALTIMTRPVALLAYVALLVLFLYCRKLKHAIVFLLFPALFIVSWSAFITMRYDHFVLTTTAGWYDMWVGNNPEATGGFEKSPEIQAFRDITHDSTVLDRVGREKYVEFLFGQPFSFLELQWRKTALYFSLLRPGGYWIHLIDHPWDLRITLGSSFVWTSVLLAGGLSGAYVLLRRRKDDAAKIFLLLAAFQPLAVIPVIVETRYRYPFFPFLAIYAAYFFVKLFSSEVSERLMQKEVDTTVNLKSVLAIVLVFLMVCTGYDFWHNFGDIVEKIEWII